VALQSGQLHMTADQLREGTRMQINSTRNS
jgi:hypothetical protein